MADTAAPRLADLKARTAQDTIARILGPFDAQVLTYDRATRRGDVRPLTDLVVEEADGTRSYLSVPVIPSVPFRFATSTGGGWSITLPVTVGDYVTVIVRGASHDEVDDGERGSIGSPVQPRSGRRFALRDAFAVPLYSDAVSNDAADGAVVVTMPSGGQLRIGNSTANKALALAELVNGELQAISAAFSEHTHALPPLVAGATPVSAAPAPPPPTPSAGNVSAAATYTPSDVASTRAFTDG